jgi:hypothetical protein
MGRERQRRVLGFFHWERGDAIEPRPRASPVSMKTRRAGLLLVAVTLSLSHAGCGGATVVADDASAADVEVGDTSRIEAQAGSTDVTTVTEASVRDAPTEDRASTPDSTPAAADASCTPDGPSAPGGCCNSQAQCPEMFCCALEHMCILCSVR